MEPKNQTQENNYFLERMNALGITEEVNQVGILHYNKDTQKNEIKQVPIFMPHEKGIEIRVYSLERLFHKYDTQTIDDQGKVSGSKIKKKWAIIRLEHPITKDDGSQMKYQMPKGAGSFPFFPPGLVDKYEQRTKIKTLFLTEGFFKAFKGGLHGLDIIGLPSITHLKEKGKETLHGEILDIILKCSVERVVWLTDGDCLDIPSKLKDEMTGQPKDLYKRPFNFYNSIVKFKQLLNDYDVEKYFMHIDSENISGHPKGLDDLLCALPDKVQEIVDDMHSVSKPGQYVQKFNITAGGITKVRNYFHLGDVTDFYLFHSEKRKDLKEQEFIWQGTQYKFSEDSNRCEVVVPAESKQYFRVGDYYYKFIHIPNQHKKLEKVFTERKKTTIMDDHGKKFITHVPKYEAFCNVPDHQNFQQIIHGCFNVYSPLDFTPDEDECTAEDCPTIIDFIKHIFGDNRAVCTIGGEQFKCSTLDMGLDYMQLMYERPDEKLPILCLVSKENATGKSTLGNFLRLMLGANVSIVGNQDIAGEFNAHWATKLVVVCDESKIDKQHVVEKVKMLSTAKKVTMNAKGKNQTEIDCFIKFVMITNHEDNFINASDEDVRYWVVKVPKLKSERPKIMDAFIEEMPAFLSYLSRRKMVTSQQGRMWFHPQLIKTDAFRKVVENARPTIEKELRQYLRDMFLDFGGSEILMTRKAIHKEFFNNKYEANYLEKILRDNLKVEQWHELDHTQLDAEGNPTKIFKTKRFTYPRWESKFEGGNPVITRVEVSENGRPFVFRRGDFLTVEEIRTHPVDAQTSFESAMCENGPAPVRGATTDTQPDLPF